MFAASPDTVWRMSDRTCHGATETQRKGQGKGEIGRQDDCLLVSLSPSLLVSVTLCLSGEFSVRVQVFHDGERVIPAGGYSNRFIRFFSAQCESESVRDGFGQVGVNALLHAGVKVRGENLFSPGKLFIGDPEQVFGFGLDPRDHLAFDVRIQQAFSERSGVWMLHVLFSS